MIYYILSIHPMEKRIRLIAAIYFCLLAFSSYSQKDSEGIRLAKNKEYAAAIETLTQEITTDPTTSRLFYWRGNANFLNNNLDGAAQDYEQALVLRKDASVAAFNLGTIALIKGDSSKAMSQFSYFWQKRPKVVNEPIQKGNQSQKDKNYLKAIKFYLKASEIAIEDFLINYYLGNCYLAINKDQEALKYYNRSIELNPTFLDSYYQRSILSYRAKNYREALDDLNFVLSIIGDSPKSSSVLLQKANVEKKIPKYDPLVLTDLEAALKLEPQRKEGKYNLGIFYLLKGKRGKAKTYLK